MLTRSRHRFLHRFVRKLALGSLLVAASCGEATVVCPEGQVLLEGDVCGDKPLACAEGTIEHDGECVGFDPNDAQAPTVTADPTGTVALTPPQVVVLTADEPSTIYYTVDGSEPTTSSDSAPSPVSVFDIPRDAELKFMAVDLAGNEGSVGTERYEVDDFPPAGVTDLAAVVQGTSISVTWTNPTDPDFAGVIVMRSVVEPEFSPVTAEAYAEGNVGPAEDILLVGTDTMVLDTTPFAGFDRYTVWTYDALGNFGEPVWATPLEPIPVPEQLGTLHIDPTTGVVTVAQQPSSFTISGSGTVDMAGTTIDLSIDLQSGVGRPFFNTKLMLESTNDGTITGDGVLGAVPYAHYGVPAMASGEVRTGTFSLSAVTGAENPIIMAVKIRDDPVLVHVSGQSIGNIVLTDSTGGGETATVSCLPVAWAGGLFGGNQCKWRDAVISLDGQFIFAAHLWDTRISVIDSSTLEVVHGVDLHPLGGVGSTSTLERSSDGQFIYAVVMLDGHYRSSGNVNGQGGARSVELVKLDGNTLEELDRVLIAGFGQTTVRMRNLAISDDGTRAATLSGNQDTLYAIDLTSMSVTSSPTSSYTTNPGEIGLEPDGSHIWVSSRSGVTNEVYRVQFDDMAIVDTVTLTDAVTRTGEINFGPDGMLYLTRKSTSSTTDGLAIIDPVAMSEVSTHYTYHTVKGVAFSPDGTVAYLHALDIAGGASLIATFDAVTHLPIDTFPTTGGSDRTGHFMLLSPF